MSAAAGGIELACPRCGASNRIPHDKRHLRARCGRCRAPLPVAPGTPLTVTDSTFQQDVLEAPLPVLVDCWAAWCAPCRALAPVIDALAGSYAGRARIAKLDVDGNPRTAARYDVQGIPTLLFFHRGRLAGRLTGVQPRSLIEQELDAMVHEAGG